MTNSLVDIANVVNSADVVPRHPVVQEDLDQIVAADCVNWSRLAGKTVLITGASGMLPSYIVEAMLRHNECDCGAPIRLVALVRNGASARRRFAAYRDHAELQIVNQDVTNPINVDGPIDFIVHAASQASPKYYGIDPVGTLLPNTEGTRRLLELARDKQVEGFLFFSSAEVYGQSQSADAVISEQSYGCLDPTAVRSCYAESKRMGETMCAAWYHQYGVPTTIVRPFHTYGPGLKLDDGRVFADFVANVVQGRDIELHSDGSAERCFCYLADATVAFLTVLLNGESGQAYNVGNDGELSSIRQLAETLVALFPEKRLKVVGKSASEDSRYLSSEVSRQCPCISKIRQLGWTPTTSIEEGFRRTIRSF